MKEEPLTATPALDRCLVSLRSRLVSKVWLHGIGTVLLAAAIWLVFAFLADWGLGVPRYVRATHGIILIAIVVVFLRRAFFAPRRRVPNRAGLAILLERAHPDLRQVLVSAVQFQRATAEELRPDQASPALVQRVLEEAEAKMAEVDARRVLDERPPRLRFVFGLGATLLLVGLAFGNPLHTRIFVDHLLGGTLAWPQRTHLAVDLGELDEGAWIDRDYDVIRARVARGTDVPVIVRSEGDVPAEIVVHFEESRDLIWNTGGRPVIRRLLPSLQEDVTFWITGGDDDDGLPRVEIEVLQPPDVEGLAMRIQPPAYCGLPERTVFDGDVEVLAGSALRIYARPSPPTATGVARLLPDETTIELEAEVTDLAEPGATWLAFDLIPEKTTGFRIELTDDTGLSNPDPGLYRVRVIEDRVPEVQVLSPARTEFEAVPGGAIPLRVRAEDDFGLAELAWRVRPVGAPGEELPATNEGVLAMRALDVSIDGDDPAAPASAALGSQRLEVDELGGAGNTVLMDQRFVFEVFATDNREPTPGVGKAIPLRMRVVSPETLLHRLTDRLGNAQMDARRLAELQRMRRTRTEELLDAAADGGGLSLGDATALQATIVGQRRVLGDARALGRELAAVAEDILYARIDDKAGGLLEFYDERASRIADLRFHPEPWRELATAHREGRLGAGGFASKLVEIVDLDLEISEEHALAAAAALDRAELALETAGVADELEAAIEHQSRALERMDDLLAKLAEWDNFQNVLTLTRDILNRQKALRERTKEFGTSK